MKYTLYNTLIIISNDKYGEIKNLKIILLNNRILNCIVGIKKGTKLDTETFKPIYISL